MIPFLVPNIKAGVMNPFDATYFMWSAKPCYHKIRCNEREENVCACVRACVCVCVCVFLCIHMSMYVCINDII